MKVLGMYFLYVEGKVYVNFHQFAIFFLISVIEIPEKKY